MARNIGVSQNVQTESEFQSSLCLQLSFYLKKINSVWKKKSGKFWLTQDVNLKEKYFYHLFWEQLYYGEW